MDPNSGKVNQEDSQVSEAPSPSNARSQAEEEEPWWKKNQRYIIFGVVSVLCVVVAVLGALFATQGKGDGSTANNNESTSGGTKPTESPTILLGSNNPAEGEPNNSTIELDSTSAAVEGSFNSPGDDSSAMPLYSNSTKEELVNPSSDEPPTLSPSKSPSAKPTNIPTAKPITLRPSKSPSAKPTDTPTDTPTTISHSILSSQIKLLPNDGTSKDFFGQSVSVSGDTVVVGAPSGSAYVFTREGGTWIQQDKLLPDGQGDDRFGGAVSISGNTVVIGAYRDDENGRRRGSAYVYIREGGVWKQQAKLLPNDGAEDAFLFGIAVAVSGDTIVVGADGSGGGSAYIFSREGDTWIQQAKLLPNKGNANDRFGFSVSVSEDTVVVGSDTYDNGSAYVYIWEGGTWKQQAKLLANDGAEGDNFGIAVAVDGHTVVVGAHWDNDNGSGSGSAYIFIREGGSWIQQAKLLPNDGAVGDKFGRAVSVSGDTVVVGAHWYDDNGIGSGSSYVFIRKGDTWKQQAKLLSNDGRAEDDFGVEVSVSGGTVVVGARSDDNENGWDSGSAYVFSL